VHLVGIYILEHSIYILEHSIYILEHSIYILEHSIYILEHSIYHGPGVDSVSNIDEYQECFLGVKAAGA